MVSRLHFRRIVTGQSFESFPILQMFSHGNNGKPNNLSKGHQQEIQSVHAYLWKKYHHV